MEKEQIESLKKDLLRKYKTAQDTFGDADEEDQANLKRFSFICLLSFDAVSYTHLLMLCAVCCPRVKERVHMGYVH